MVSFENTHTCSIQTEQVIYTKKQTFIFTYECDSNERKVTKSLKESKKGMEGSGERKWKRNVIITL